MDMLTKDISKVIITFLTPQDVFEWFLSGLLPFKYFVHWIASWKNYKVDFVRFVITYGSNVPYQCWATLSAVSHYWKVTDTEAFEYAADFGNLWAMKWLVRCGLKPTPWTSVSAGNSDDINILNWMFQNRFYYVSSMCLTNAIENGKINSVKWMLKIGIHGCNPEELLCDAYRYGKEEIIDLVKNKLISLNLYVNNLKSLLYNKAIRNNDLSDNVILKNLNELSSQHVPITMENVKKAVKSGRLPIIKWFWSHTTKNLWNTETFYIAAKSNRLEVVKWLRLQRVPWNSDALKGAFQNNNLEMFWWLLLKKCPVSEALIQFMLQCNLDEKKMFPYRRMFLKKFNRTII
jgi:hypothetical protein